MNSIRVVRKVSRVASLPQRIAGAGKGWRNPLAVSAVPACAAFLWGALSLSAFGQPSGRTVAGITSDWSNGRPVPEVQITARNINKGTDRSTVSNTDGVFMFTDLEPGPYEFEAVKEGFRKASARSRVDDRQ